MERSRTMRRSIAFTATLLVLAGSAWPAETEIDSDFMQAVEDVNNSLSSDIAERNAKAIVAEAKDLLSRFEQIQLYYEHKGEADDAVKLSRKSRDLAAEIVTLVSAKDFDTAAQKATDLSRACKTCHNFYKKS